MLTIDQVSHAYARSGARALDKVTLSLAEGVTAIVGVNGAGKSTLMRILARALVPQRGRVRLDGLDVHREARRLVAARIGYMPQQFSLPAGARVLDSLVYLGWLKGLGAAEALRQSQQVLASVGLSDRADAMVAALSGGMNRRFALAQALVSDPDVLLLDEPTTGLDPEQRAAIRDLLADPDHRAPVTVLSSHLMEDVEQLADRVVLLDRGRVRFAGSVDDFRRRPDGTRENAEAAFLRRLVEES